MLLCNAARHTRKQYSLINGQTEDEVVLDAIMLSPQADMASLLAQLGYNVCVDHRPDAPLGLINISREDSLAVIPEHLIGNKRRYTLAVLLGYHMLGTTVISQCPHSTLVLDNSYAGLTTDGHRMDTNLDRRARAYAGGVLMPKFRMAALVAQRKTQAEIADILGFKQEAVAIRLNELKLVPAAPVVPAADDTASQALAS